MSLPFLRKHKDTSNGTEILERNSNQSEDQNPEEAHEIACEACGNAIMAALLAKDPKAIAYAIQDLIALGDSNQAVEPAPHSYDAQNQKAVNHE